MCLFIIPCDIGICYLHIHHSSELQRWSLVVMKSVTSLVTSELISRHATAGSYRVVCPVSVLVGHVRCWYAPSEISDSWSRCGTSTSLQSNSYVSQSTHVSSQYTLASLLWPPSVADANIIFLSCGFFFLLLLSFFSLPNLSRRRLDAYHASTHGVALVRIYELWCRSETCCTRLAEIQDPKNGQNATFGHHGTTLSGYVFATKARIDNRKKTC